MKNEKLKDMLKKTTKDNTSSHVFEILNKEEENMIKGGRPIQVGCTCKSGSFTCNTFS